MNTRETIDSIRQAKLELQDSKLLEQFWFTDDRHVTATVGEKNGPVCAPILVYRITESGSIVIGDGKSDWYQWEDIQVEGNVLRVRCGERAKDFTIEWPKQKQRYLP